MGGKRRIGLLIGTQSGENRQWKLDEQVVEFPQTLASVVRREEVRAERGRC